MNDLVQRMQQIEKNQAAQLLHSQLILYRQPTATTVRVGTAVAWDAVGKNYVPAIASATTNAGHVATTALSDVLGIVIKQYGSKLADILIFGLWETNAIPSGVTTPGRYFLSDSIAGDWTKVRPALSRPLGILLQGATTCDSRSTFFVAPGCTDWSAEHEHRVFMLYPLPAGTHEPPEPYDPHEITSPDVDLPGWLPADHAIFAGKAPANAKFGYNLAKHPELAAAWPPVPLEAVSLEYISDYSLTRTYGGVPPEYVTFTNHGIWWMTDGHGHVPWPTNYSSSGGDPTTDWTEYRTPGTPPVDMKLKLCFAKSSYSGEREAVRTLRAADNSGLKIRDMAGVPAISGDLQISLALELLVNNLTKTGHVVLKSLDGDKLEAGPVTEGIYTRGGALTITSSAPATTTIGGISTQLHQGHVRIESGAELAAKELSPQITLLNDAVERVLDGLPYLACPAGRISAISFRMHVPTTGFGTGDLKMRFRAVLFGTSAGTMEALAVTYRRIARPTSGSPADVGGTATPLTVTTAVGVSANKAVEVLSEEITVAYGDTVIVTVTRNTNTYPGEIGIIRANGVIS